MTAFNYHFGIDAEGREREPPHSYLARVAIVFPDINPEWLLMESGPVLKAEQASAVVTGPDKFQRTRASVLAAIFADVPALWPINVFGIDALILAVVPEVAAWIGTHGVGISEAENGADRYIEAARMLGRAIAAPLEALQLDPARWRGAMGTTMDAEYIKAQYLAALMPMLVPLLNLEFMAAVRERRAIADPTEEEGDDAS